MPAFSSSRLALVIGLVLFFTGTLFAASSLGPASAATPTPTPKLEFVSSIGGSITSIAVSGSVAYMGQGTTLTALDISNPSEIEFLSNVRLPDFTKEIALSGSHAFLANNNGGLQIVDVSNPLSLSVSSFYTALTAVDVKVVGDLVYVIGQIADTYTATLMIFDIANPSLPVLLGSFSSVDLYEGFDVAGNLVYIATHGDGLLIIDVANPANPVLTTTYQSLVQPRDIQIHNNLAFLVGLSPGIAYDQLQILDVSNPTNPIPLGSSSVYNFPDPFSGYRRIQLVGTLAYVSSRYVLDVIDISVPISPSRISNHHVQTADFQVVGTNAYIGTPQGLFYIQDVSLISSGLPIGSYSSYGFSSGDVDIHPPYLYVSDDLQKIRVFDIRTPAKPTLISRNEFTGNGSVIRVIEDIAYVNGTGFNTYDISTPNEPKLLGGLNPTSYLGNCLEISGTLAYLGREFGGLRVVDISNPTSPQLISYLTGLSGSDLQDLKVVGNYIYVAAGNGGLVVIDQANLPQLTIVGRYDVNLWASDIDVIGNLAYVGGSFSDGNNNNRPGLHIFDVSNPQTPNLISLYKLEPGSVRDIQVKYGYAFIATDVGLWVFDIRDPLIPTLYDFYPVSFGASGIEVNGDYAYLTASSGGLWILRFTPPLLGKRIYLPMVVR